MNNQRQFYLDDYGEETTQVGSDYDSPKHISFVITNFKGLEGLLAYFYVLLCIVKQHEQYRILRYMYTNYQIKYTVILLPGTL